MFCICSCLVYFLISDSNSSMANSIIAKVHIVHNAKNICSITKATKFGLNFLAVSALLSTATVINAK